MASIPASDLLARALALPAEERVALATELLDSVEAPEDLSWTEAWAAELDSRLKSIDEGTEKCVPWEELRAKLADRLRQR
jgi:putative addiction module component (TIGR02574 family)